MHLAIIIVNYCTPDLTIGCLNSLQADRDDLPPGTQVVIVDGCSTDDSVLTIRSAIEQGHSTDFVTLLPLDANRGFAYANNQGMQAIRGARPRFVLLLNPDTVVRPGAVSRLLSFMDAHPRAGIAGSRLEDPDGTPQSCAFRFHSAIGEFEAATRLGFISRLSHRWRVAPPPPSTSARMDWVSGACMLIRSEIFDQIGLLDDGYFMYYEEADFCLRAAQAGWECWHVPESRVIHLVGQASGVTIRNTIPGRRPDYWFKSRQRYFVKNHGWLYAALADVAWTAGHLLWRVRRALQRKPDYDPPMLLRDFMRNSVFARGTH
jgi:GT2 family glycosyltransferase